MPPYPMYNQGPIPGGRVRLYCNKPFLYQYDDEYLEHLGQLNEKLAKIREEIDKMPKSKSMTNSEYIDDIE